MEHQEAYRGFDLGRDDFANNPDPRVPCVLLLDTSYSMSGKPIDELNAGIVQFRDELLTDNLASRRAEISVFTFGGDVVLHQDFVTARDYQPMPLAADGATPMANAIIRGIKHIEDRKPVYQRHGVLYYRPWLFLITDGAPTDDAAAWRCARDAVTLGEQQNKFSMFAIGTADADFAKLREVSPARSPIQLKGLAFREFFQWLSNSLTRVSASQVGQRIALPSSEGWGEVPT